MRLYIDSADRAASESLLATGLFAGLTTNPTILQRAAQTVRDIPEIYRWAKAAGAKEIFFQAWGETSSDMVSCALRLRELGNDVVIKVPATRAGSAACATLTAQGIPTLLTAVYGRAQAMVAAAAGADYIAPYLGKLGDAGRDGIEEIAAMHRVLTATGSRTKVLAASIRDTASMVSLAELGVECFTFAPAIGERLFVEPLTAEAVGVFDQTIADSETVAA